MTDVELTQLKDSVDRMADAFIRVSDALAKHGAILAAYRKEIDQLGMEVVAHRSTLSDLGQLPTQVISACELLERHQRVLERLTGSGPGPEVVN